MRAADEGGVLVAVLHHIISDGASLTILHRDLVAAYDAALAGRPQAERRCRCSFPMSRIGSRRGSALPARRSMPPWRRGVPVSPVRRPGSICPMTARRVKAAACARLRRSCMCRAMSPSRSPRWRGGGGERIQPLPRPAVRRADGAGAGWTTSSSPFPPRAVTAGPCRHDRATGRHAADPRHHRG